MSHGVHPWLRAAGGAGAALVEILGFQAVSRHVVPIPNPGVFYVLTVACCGYAGGFWAALGAVPPVLLSIALVYSIPSHPFAYTTDNFTRLIVVAISVPTTAVLVGILKQRADQNLAASDARFESYLQAAPYAIVVEQEDQIVYANPAAHALFRAKPGELVGTAPRTLLPTDSQERPPRGTVTVPLPALQERRFVARDGTAFDAEVAASTLQFDRRPATLTILNDVTHRHAMERRIARQLDELGLVNEVSRALLFGMVADDVPDYVCGIIRDRLALTWAAVARVVDGVVLFPSTGPCTPGADCCEPVHGSDPVSRAARTVKPVLVAHVATDPTAAAWADHAAANGYRAAVAIPLVHADSVMGVLTVGAADRADLGDGTVTLLQSLANLTAIALSDAEAHELLRQRARELEATVAARTAELRRAIEELEAFTYSVSHDLRAPLRAITGFAEIVDRRYGQDVPPEATRYLGHILRASEHMTRLIDDLLDYAKLGRRRNDFQPVDVANVLRHVLADLADRVARAGARIDLPPRIPFVQAEPLLLRQVLTNLLDNALTYAGKDRPPDVSVTADTDDLGRVTIAVRDNGIGIAPEYHGVVFDIFQRLHSHDEYPGTGIGLAIVKKSVGLMDGQVWVESAPGAGSTFRVRLPAAAARTPLPLEVGAA